MSNVDGVPVSVDVSVMVSIQGAGAGSGSGVFRIGISVVVGDVPIGVEGGSSAGSGTVDVVADSVGSEFGPESSEQAMVPMSTITTAMYRARTISAGFQASHVPTVVLRRA